MTQEEREQKFMRIIDEITRVMEMQVNTIQRLETSIEKHEKAIGLLLKEVKDLRDRKPTIYKP
jgi:hypothetical protein